MLLLAVCLYVITKARVINYDNLISDVKYTLDECLNIVDYAGEYVEDVRSLDVRRRATDVKLRACFSILGAVDTHRVKHNREVLIQSFTEWPGNILLNLLLKPVSKRMGEVLYIASRDGDGAGVFHTKCDNKGPTIVVVQSTTGAIFGGYTDVAWTRSVKWGASTTSFLFRLHPSVEKYDVKSGLRQYSVALGKYKYGPIFGHGYDLQISDNSLHNSKSYVNGHTYNTPANKPYVLNDGHKFFKVRDYFVVRAI